MERRLRIVPVTGEAFVDLMKHGSAGLRVVANALPADAMLMGSIPEPAAYHGYALTVFLVVMSQEFDVVPEGGIIPRHPDVMLQKL